MIEARAVEPVSGYWDANYTPLVETFSAMIEAGQERGAICVMREGDILLNIWGGVADPQATPGTWRHDTLACCFSVSKGVLSLLAHRMADLGKIDLNAPIAQVWPQFAAKDKAEITIMDALTHRAGLPAVSGLVERGDLYNWQRMTDALAASVPVVRPRASPVYHNMTFGHLLGETLSRADAGLPLTRLLERYLTGPLHVDFHFALSPKQQQRTARLEQEDPGALFRSIECEPETLFSQSMRFFGGDEDFNSTGWRSAVIGSGSGHATAMAIAQLYGQLVWRNSLLSPQRQVAARTERVRSEGNDPVMGIPIRYAEGFELSLPPNLDFGPNPDTVGYWGAGGATGFADPAAGISFGYITGIMTPGLGSSSKCRRLVAELYRCF